MNKVLLGTALLLSVAATSAVAGPNWNQASISYLSADFGDEDVSGVGISGTKLLNSNFFVAGGYSVLSEDVGNGVDLNLNTLSLGLGVRKAVANNTDIFGVVSFQNIELEAASGWTSLASDDASGYGLTAGARSMVSPQFELSVAISYVEIEDESETSFDLGADYYFTNQFGVGVGYGTADDVDTLSFTGTMNF